MVKQTNKPKGLQSLAQRLGGKEPMEALREKGKHFDQEGEKTTLAKLLELDGLFPLKDVKDRIPIPERRLKKMVYGGGTYAACFFNPFKDENSRGVLYVDLVMLNYLIQERLKTGVLLESDGED